MTPSRSRSQALVTVSVAYVAALAIAIAVIYALARSHPDGSLIVRLALADVAATTVIFAFSYHYKNSSFYDAYWSVIPLVLAPYLVWLGWDSGADHGRALLAAALVVSWGVGLTHNWARGWTGLDHEDWRYVRIRELSGKLYWPVSYLGIHMFPTVQVLLGCVPLIWVTTEPGAPLGWLDALACLVMVTGIAFERVADNQLRDYVLHRKKPGETMTEGLWAWSRHPNYFGELCVWWGLYLFGVAAIGLRPWYLISGAVAMSLMFHFVSIPLIEKRMVERRRDYVQVQDRISRLVPWLPKR